ncbi:MAG: LamG domain-containing protein, partial [Fibrobacterales bacterium]
TNSGTVNIAGNIGQAVDYEGADWISLPAANFSDLTTQVSVSCWIYGDAAMQPQNNLLFRGSDVSGNNALAAYVPWSDQNVFWDAGNVGVLLNRLYGAVDASKWEGAWVYYTFTKDQTTGALEIFINGNSEMSGTGYTYTFSTIVTFLLGAYTVGQFNYDG